MKRLIMKSNKKADACVVDNIIGDIASIKDVSNEIKPVVINVKLTKIKVKKHDGYAIIKLNINNNGYSTKAILIRYDDVENLLKELVVGKQYKFKGCIRKIFFKKIFIIKQIESREK